VLLDNQTAMEAAAERAAALGFAAAIACDINEQPIDEGSALLLARARSLRNHPSCLISGGEFSCVVSGIGRGGRNLETALRCAIKLDQDQPSNHTVVMSAGTDGIDGSSFAAGAIADETTISRAKELGLDALEFLEQSDSHAFFEALGDLIVTGPTGTNVRDARIVLRG
jgi:hydroxypyruvate reductase